MGIGVLLGENVPGYHARTGLFMKRLTSAIALIAALYVGWGLLNGRRDSVELPASGPDTLVSAFWTHLDPNGRHEAGWLKHNGKVIQ